MNIDTSEPDLAILGAGAAGMMAAQCAARRGLSVVLFDPHYSSPNNLSISGGLFPAAGSRLQAGAGVGDSPSQWLADLRAFAGASVNERIASAIAECLPRVVDFLLDECAAPIRFLADVPAPGHSATRFHSVAPAAGRALHAWLRQAVRGERRIECITDHAVDSVTRVTRGFEIHATTTSSTRQVRARRLMLAGGGFGGNPDMVARFIPEMRGALHSGTATNDGSVIAMAMQWGAALAGMDGYQGQGHANPASQNRLGMSLPTLGSIMLDRAGRRFVREDLGPSALAAHVLAQPGQVALEVFDAHIEEQLGNHSAYVDAHAAGKVFNADSVAELAAAAGMSPARLAQTLDEAAAYARGERADPLGRREFARVLQAPYRASWVTGSLAHTQGGVVTDAAGRVLDSHGAVIPALYAAGGCAAGLSGRGGEGYLPGNGLAQSFGLAWLAVAAMADAGGA